MRHDPTFHRVQLPAFDGAPLAGSATLAFEANHTKDVSAGRHITVEAGRRGTWILRLTVGDALPAGSQVAFRKVENEFRFDYIHQDYWPEAMGYVTVEDQHGTPQHLICDTALKSPIPAVVTLDRRFEPGEQLVLRIGDQQSGGAGIAVRPATYDRAHIEVGVLLPGSEVWQPVPEAKVSVVVAPCPPVKRYHLWAPSTARSGEIIEATALPVDVNGNPLPGGENLAITTEDGDQAVLSWPHPPAVQAITHLDAQGVTRLHLEDREHGLVAQSNPIQVDPPAWQIYWGEFHCHGYDAVELNVLNETTHPDKAYRYGRDVTRLDFMAMGSHIFRENRDAVGQWWELYRDAAHRYDEPGRYVPFLGCEWRDKVYDGGDRNLIWQGLDAPMPDPAWRIDEVYARLAEQGGMVTPHVGGAIALPYHHNPEAEWLCEMTSGHGNFEWFAQAYLQKGYKVGLIGGSDGHKGTPGHPRVVAISGGRFANVLRRRDAGWSGGPILAVLAERLDRDALWAAFQARRTYATTGARALLAFEVNGAPMGSAITAEDVVIIRFEVYGTAPIERVTLIRDDRQRAQWTFNDAEMPVHVAKQMEDRPPEGVTYYYLRIEQADGELIWSSPVWVEAHGTAPEIELPAWNEPVTLDLDAIGENAATPHLKDLVRYIRTEEQIEAFSDLTPYTVVDAPAGKYAVFLAHLRGRRVRIHWFYEFELPRLRFETGWVHYGREMIMYQPWATPLFENQVLLGGAPSKEQS